LKRFGFITCVTAALLALPASFAGTLLNENFENGAGLADGNWANPGSAQIVTDPQNAGNKVVRFNSFGVGGDLFSKIMAYAADPQYDGRLFVSFDFLEVTGPTHHAYVGTDHQTSPFGAEQWLWSNAGDEPFSTNPPLNTWTHVSFAFSPFDPGATGSIVLKLEAVPGEDYFDNITLATAPEPGTAVLGAVCLLALWLIVRVRQNPDDENE
jgi:hypothetical protein